VGRTGIIRAMQIGLLEETLLLSAAGGEKALLRRRLTRRPHRAALPERGDP
jgi:hypothetical protein